MTADDPQPEASVSGFFFMRATYSWTLPRTTIELGRRTIVMGILNVTPDSFSEGRDNVDPVRARDRAQQIEAQGADILDVGAESTKPGGTPVDATEEMRRLGPVLQLLARSVTIPISVDTYRAATARAAIDAGAQIINDISGFRLDSGMARLAAESVSGVVLMHSRGDRAQLHDRKEDDSASAIRDELASVAAAGVEAGVSPGAIVLDPGIGFGKSPETNLKVLKRLDLFSTLGYPLLAGISRKSFIRIRVPVSDAPLWATSAASTAAILGGAHILRVHDVAQMRAVAEMADAIEGSGD